MNYRVPLARPAPDIDSMMDVAMGRKPIASRPPLVEYIVDEVHVRAVAKMLGRPLRDDGTTTLDDHIQWWYRLGFDYVRIERNVGFAMPGECGQDPTTRNHTRSWYTMAGGAIADRQGFEQYPWPNDSDRPLTDIAYVNDHLPEGMGLIASHAAGVYEHLSGIMGYENLCIQLHEDPDLVQAVADRVGGLMACYYRRLVQLDRLAAVWAGDDMGFKTATLIAPDQLRRYVLPWHKRFARIAHDAGKPYFLHTCGHTLEITDDLIDDVGIDGKHSFEDAVIPIAEFQQRYAGRLAVLGGVDVDMLTRGDEPTLRKYVRGIIEQCSPRGRFAIGSGNSFPSYVPIENYLIMLDEALK
ncbi:MAG TPA: uroporphyrinogen decarboxylase family protein [Phycisphaerae bacterium]|nr:uroporphyrinogen decarboxylase family protein [Phycisphaerae bacterium]